MFDRAALSRAVAAQGVVVRVVICAHQGSAPREAGTAMLVWAEGQDGTIGGGTLEHEATLAARRLLAGGAPRLERIALGPALGQCCGGAVTLGFERFDADALDAVPESGVYARPLTRDAGEAPLPLRRHLRETRAGAPAGLRFVQNWLAEPVATAGRPLWVWGAGHVGRALTGVLAPLPDVSVTWIDTAADRFPATIPGGVTQRIAADPAALVALAPRDAEHLILTFSHALDLELCHRLLGHGFAACGVIGSASKAARFRSRLAALGHAPASIARLRCPIGDPALGKHPQAIAVSVAADLLSRAAVQTHAPSRKVQP